MRLFLVVLLQFTTALLFGQKLQPGFDKAEYAELMKVSSRTTANVKYYTTVPAPERFKMIYQSPVLGIDNLWDLWTDGNGIAVISIRGTTENMISSIANLYTAMVPANGELQLSKTETFKYELSTNPRAAVHVGWLACTGFLSKDILPKLDSIYKKGTKDILIMGHSQGAAIAFLLTAYLYHLQIKNALPTNIRFKTYCSAGPKPGNIFFAYDYAALTQNGWGYNVVNSADWVPQSPISIQALPDFNITNPFTNAKPMIKKLPFPKDLAILYGYNRLDKSTRKATKKYRKYLGTMMGKMIKKNIPGFSPPVYDKSMDYVSAGNTIVLLADEAYYKIYPDSDTNMFAHHFHNQYLYLLEKLK